jgi:hypothetical protein
LLVYGCQGRSAIVRDLYYHDRHIASNLEWAISSFGKVGVPPENLQYLRRWAMAERLRQGLPSGSDKPSGN